MVFYRSYTNVNSNQYKSNIMNGDLNNIIEVVNEVCDVDVRFTRSRIRKHINAKKIYCHISFKIGLYTMEEIGRHIGVTHATVISHVKSFEYVLIADPLLRRNLDSCWLKVNNILGLKNFDYKDRVMMNWKHLTIEQRQKLAMLSEKFTKSNTINEQAYV